MGRKKKVIPIRLKKISFNIEDVVYFSNDDVVITIVTFLVEMIER